MMRLELLKLVGGIQPKDRHRCHRDKEQHAQCNHTSLKNVTYCHIWHLESTSLNNVTTSLNNVTYCHIWHLECTSRNNVTYCHILQLESTSLKNV
ncbi:uncharacterized protein LOC127865647 [Dreissena polymorpha]|uniref:uncharacterized protein LOC127865647 n=1 Tax=Dreissena polymorpha TaxID=45954 RepID=UPI0022654BFD|nr:uncharacterized protein LOC127865647 [Dreissena polymorpha]